MKHFSYLLVAVGIAVLCISGAGFAVDNTVNNPYGAHLLLSDMSKGNIEKHLTWVKSLVGPRGYVKQLFMGITKNTPGAPNDWKLFIQESYNHDLIPVVRLASDMNGGVWNKPVADGPNDYTSVSAAIKRVVSDLPRSDKYPLYVEIFNEPNNHYEWSNQSDPVEYGNFLVQASKAIRSIGDPHIKVLNGALSPGGSYNNLKFIDVMCREVPGFIDSFDVWASHPYPNGPPEINRHDKKLPMPKWTYGIDGYQAELDVLAKYGRKNVKVMLTETGYSLDADGEDVLADQTLRVYRDCWIKWPEVLAILPFTFNDPYAGFAAGDWVYTGSGTDANGLPTKAHGNYWAVYKLAKPNDPFGSISGKVMEGRFHSPLAGADVLLSTGVKTKTDGAGNYWFPKLQVGKYKVKAWKSEYKLAYSSDIAVTNGQNAVGNVNLTALKQGTFSGIIRDTITGNGLEGVTITTTPGAFKAVTGKEGAYKIINVPPSRYSLTVSKPGYYSVKKERIAVGPGDAVETSLFTGPGAPPAGKSLIGDVSFERGDDGPAGGWTIWDNAQKAGALSVDHTVAFTGNSSQKITPKGSARNHVWEMTNYSVIFPGRKYRLEVWAKTQDAVGQVKLVGGFFTNETVQVGSFESTNSLSGTNGWTKLVAEGVAPQFSHGSPGRMQVKLLANLKSGTAWFDEAAAVEE